MQVEREQLKRAVLETLRGHKTMAPAKRQRKSTGSMRKKTRVHRPLGELGLVQFQAAKNHYDVTGGTQSYWTVYPITTPGDGTGTPATGTSQLALSSISEGTGKDDRQGRKALIKKVHGRVDWAYIQKDEDHAGRYGILPEVHMALVLYKNNAGGNPTNLGASIWDEAGFTADLIPGSHVFRNTDNTGDFKILWQKSRTLQLADITTNHGTDQSNTLAKRAMFEFNVELSPGDQEFRYSGTGGTAGEHSGPILLLFYNIDNWTPYDDGAGGDNFVPDAGTDTHGMGSSPNSANHQNDKFATRGIFRTRFISP